MENTENKTHYHSDYSFAGFLANEGDFIRVSSKLGDGFFYIGILKYMSGCGTVVFHAVVDSEWELVTDTRKYDFGDLDRFSFSLANGNEIDYLVSRLDDAGFFWDWDSKKVMHKFEKYEEFSEGDTVNIRGTLYRVVRQTNLGYLCTHPDGGNVEISYNIPCVRVDIKQTRESCDDIRLRKAEELMKLRGVSPKWAGVYLAVIDGLADIIGRLERDGVLDKATVEKLFGYSASDNSND